MFSDKLDDFLRSTQDGTGAAEMRKLLEAIDKQDQTTANGWKDEMNNLLVFVSETPHMPVVNRLIVFSRRPVFSLPWSQLSRSTRIMP